MLLGYGRHRKVVLDEERYQSQVLLCQAVAASESAHVHRAKDGVIAAAALCDVVVQRRHIQQPLVLEPAHQLTGQGELVGQFRHGEASQVANHHEDVLVDRVDVEEVVLHLADNPAEFRQVAAEDPVLVHAAKLVHDSPGLLEDLEEQQPVDWIAAVPGVDSAAGTPKSAQGGGRHPAQFLMLLHQQKALEDGRGLALVQVLTAGVEEFAVRLDPFVEVP